MVVDPEFVAALVRVLRGHENATDDVNLSESDGDDEDQDKEQDNHGFATEGAHAAAQRRLTALKRLWDMSVDAGVCVLLCELRAVQTLEDLLLREAPLGLEVALDLFSSILAGIAAAHDAGVLHRDLKPANVLLSREGGRLVPKVADFGIAKVVEEARGGRTAAGVTMGTPGYLAPEQILDSADTDARADVFALGAILYEMLSGKQAFADATGAVSVRSTLEGDCLPLEQVVSGVPSGICAAVGRALERKRDDETSVLIGTDSRWEGIDVPGEALTLLVVTRLPFASPGHPLTQARMDLMKQRGYLDGFTDDSNYEKNLWHLKI